MRNTKRNTVLKPYVLMARIGLLARGLVFLLVGALGMQTAIVGSIRTVGPKEVFFEIALQPYGRTILISITIGLFAFSTWRFIQALLDPEEADKGPKAFFVRSGLFISAVLHMGLGYSALKIATELGLNTGNQSMENWIAFFFGLPFGPWVIGAIGTGMIIVGLFQLFETYTVAFADKIVIQRMNPETRRIVFFLGIFGRTALQIILILLGGFLVNAAWAYNPRKAAGLAETLDTIARQTYGSWMLGGISAGLFSYGCFVLILIVFRRFYKED